MKSDQPGNAPPAGSALSSLSGWRSWGWKRWSLTVAAAVVLPKCLICLIGYAAVATGFATAAPELCGGSKAGLVPAPGLFASTVATGLAIAGVLIFGKSACCRETRNRAVRSSRG